ncbi:MAG: PAS domain S-box protein, partial [Methanomicrobiales archaeon]|nr:PAS domain S-box protein [Methanomicrobiales archaeon]
MAVFHYMAVTLLAEFVLLFQMACVVFLFAYLFSKSRFYEQVLEHRTTIATQVLLAAVFGLLSIYGMSSGISFYTANVNIRDFGPMAGGLACGPYVGIGAGIIGFLYRLSVGGTNVWAVALGPLAAGIIGGLVYHYSNRELAPVYKAVIVTFLAESLISAVAIIVRILGGEAYEKWMTVTVNVALPMIIMTSIAIGVFCLILHNQIRDRKTQVEKMHLELELESKRNLAAIINTIAFPVYVLSRDHRLVLVNDSYCRFLGKPREEILGKNHRHFFTGEDADRHWDRVETAFATHGPRVEELTITRPADNGRVTIISTSTMYTDTSGREFMVGAIEDITERTRMQQALADSEAWYRILFNHTGTATIIINENGIIDQANAEFCQMTGYTKEEIEGHLGWMQMTHPDDLERLKEYHKKRRLDPGSAPATYTFRGLNRSGLVRTLYVSIAMLPGMKKSIASYIDISEQKRTEEALTQVNKKLNLLSSITRHDIINQLLILKGFLVLVKKKTIDPALADYIDRSEKATLNIERQITFTRDYQDMGVKAPAWQNVKSTIIAAKGALSLGEVVVEVDHPDLEILADPLFEKVFYNLIDNSLKYGGEKMNRIRISSREDGDRLFITYEDNGAGIAPADHEHLFERGFGKHSGFGLFLSQEM